MRLLRVGSYFTICYTICLCVSPGCDGYRALKNGSIDSCGEHDMQERLALGDPLLRPELGL